MKQPIVTPVFAIYLLHFDEPVGGKQHYLGICKAQRLHERMLEHSCGNGANLTRRVAESGIPFTITATWATSEPRMERKLKRGGHMSRFCAICQGERKQMTLALPSLRYEPRLPLSPSFMTGWTADGTGGG